MYGKSNVFEIGLIQSDPFEMKLFWSKYFTNRLCGMSDLIKRSKIIILPRGCDFEFFGFFFMVSLMH